MGSKLINKVLSQTTDTDTLIEIFETEDGDTILYSTTQTVASSRKECYEKLIDILNKLVKDEAIKNKILE
jgi:hypothetical protein